MHRANEVRPVLARIGRLAEKYECAVLFIMHMSKMGQVKALYRALGSIDIPAVARSMLVLGKHPENPEQRLMCHEKSSLAKHGQSIIFHIDPAHGGVLFDGFSDITANEMLTPSKGTRNKPSLTLEEASEALNNLLGEEGVVKLEDAKALADEMGFSYRTLYNARDELYLQTLQVGQPPRRDTWWLGPEVDKDEFKLCHYPPKQIELCT